LWGHRFVNVLNYRRRDEEYKVDYGSFNKLIRVEDMPTCSAKAMRDQRAAAGNGNGQRKVSGASHQGTPGPNHRVVKVACGDATATPPVERAAARLLKPQNVGSLPLLPQIRVTSSAERLDKLSSE
jgi:hypothetical protein